jgi:hypothetical protein
MIAKVRRRSTSVAAGGHVHGGRDLTVPIIAIKG